MNTEKVTAWSVVRVPSLVELVKFGMISAMVVSGMITEMKAEAPFRL